MPLNHAHYIFAININHTLEMLAININHILVRILQAHEVLDQNTFPGAAATNDGHAFAFADLEGNILENGLRSKTLVDVRNLDHEGYRTARKNSVRKKLEIRMAMHECTTASLVARPTPSAPLPQLRP